MVGLHAFHRLAARIFILGRELAIEHLVGVRGQTEGRAGRRCGAATVGASFATHLGKFASGVHATKIFTTVRVDDHPRLEWGCRLACPGEELLPVAAERDFDEMRHSVKATR